MHGAGSLAAAAVTLVVGVLSVLFTAVVTLASLLVPLLVVAVAGFFVYRALSTGQGTIVVQSPLLALATAAANPQPAAPKRLKKVVCGSCGGSKLTPPKTAFVYCDYCGALCDWDFQLACRTAGSAKPGPAYEALQAVEGPKQAAAKAAGDRQAYVESTKRVFDAHFTHAKASWSPRLGDPEYRAALLEHTAQQYAAAAFDPECSLCEAAMNESVRRLQWVPAFPQPRVEPRSFAVLLDAVLAHNARFTELGRPFLDTHPDQPTVELQRRIARSAFAQGWMSFLDKPGQDAMIAKLELGGDYLDVPDAKTELRHCGGCARELRVVDGAKKVVCEDCGHTNDVAHPEIRCTGCGGNVSVLFHKRAFRCPSCDLELRLD